MTVKEDKLKSNCKVCGRKGTLTYYDIGGLYIYVACCEDQECTYTATSSLNKEDTIERWEEANKPDIIFEGEV